MRKIHGFNESTTEGDLIKYILSKRLNESTNGPGILSRLKEIAKKGLLTGAIVLSVLPSLNAAEQRDALNTAQQAGIEMQVNNVEDEIYIICIKVICETPAEEGFKNGVEMNKKKAVKAASEKCAELGETNAKFLKLRNVSSGQTSYAKKDSSGTAVSVSSVCSVIEVWVAVGKDYGDMTIRA